MNPIAITGMHRSGTSMITRALHDSGLHLVGSGADDLIDAADDNPEGFWENKAVVACNDDLLEAAGGAWDAPPALPPQAVDDPRLSHVVDAATAAIAALSEHEPWGFKDPRTCLTAGFWLDLRPDLRFVLCVRHPLEVAVSLKRRNQNSYSLALALWERYYATVLAVVPPERRIVTHYDTFFVDPEGELARVCAFTGLAPTPPRVRTELRHHTIAVSLEDAGVSPTVRALYAELCREAGVVVPPESPADEGRVRRLVIDGAVAQRHAEQRQAAIERLQEREAEFRRQHAAVEEELRQRVRAVERELANVTQRPVAEAARRTAAGVRRRLRPYVGRARSPVGRAAAMARATRRGMARAARSAAHRASPPNRPEPGAGAASRPGAVTVPRPEAADGAAVASRQWAPAHARRMLRLVRRAVTDPVLALTVASRALPPPARGALRRGGRAARRVQRLALPAVGQAAVPKGPALRRWKRGYERMVADVVPGAASTIVITPGSPRKVREAMTPRATCFPHTRGGRPIGDAVAHVAQLDALRYRGHRFLVLPEGSRPWFRQQSALRDHVTQAYRLLADAPGAGAVFDLTRPPDVDARSLRGEVLRLVAGRDVAPAVLDWTSFGVETELPGMATFRPPAGETLPYLDATVDVVVVDGRGAAAASEARRVAALAVVSVARGRSGADVQDVWPVDVSPDRPAPRVLVWSDAADEQWCAELSARASAAGAEVRFGDGGHAAARDDADHDVVVFVEPHVLPLPGAIEEAVGIAVVHRSCVIAAKILGPDGRLEAAGGTVFADRSVALVANGSADVRGAWHDYVRPVCWAPGLGAVSSELLRAAAPPVGLGGRAFLREWCADVWASGGSVVYHPTVAAVRVDGDGEEPSLPLGTSAWQRVLDLRPARPAALDDRGWQRVLARDDVEACRA